MDLQKICAAVCKVLHDADIEFTQGAVKSNLKLWSANKKGLLELFRKHPNWDEEKLAIILTIDDNRLVDDTNIWQCKTGLINLICDMPGGYDKNADFANCINALHTCFVKNIGDNESGLISHVKQISGIDKIVVGQKRSRAVNIIAKHYGIDKHPMYNTRFAALADALNPINIKRQTVISLNPCDYLQMSNSASSWTSNNCHRLRGEYRAGTLSYMTDDCTFIFYTLNTDKPEGELYNLPKNSRQVFCYSDGILLQSTLYPCIDNDEKRTLYRNIVQGIISDCTGVANLWDLKTSHNNIIEYVEEIASCHFADYERIKYKPTLSILKNLDYVANYVIPGGLPYCLTCGEREISPDRAGSFICDSCTYEFNCAKCGKEINEDSLLVVDDEYFCEDCTFICDGCYDTRMSYVGVYVDPYFFCPECVMVCEHCDEAFYKDDVSIVNNITLCSSCASSEHFSCEDCGHVYKDVAPHGLNGKKYCLCCYEKRRISTC